MDKLSRVLTDYYLNKNYISSDKKEIYEYGFKLIIADLINFSLVLILGAIVRRFSDSVVFLITLCTVRQFSGGFHAKTFWLCRLSMVITFIRFTFNSKPNPFYMTVRDEYSGAFLTNGTESGLVYIGGASTVFDIQNMEMYHPYNVGFAGTTAAITLSGTVTLY